ncbi:MAG: sensor histidine kinase, partial [Ornithinibacter sp.]
LVRAQQALRNVEDQLDRIAHELRPSALDDLGLEDAVRSHVETWSRESGIAADLHTHGLRTGRLPPNVENTVFRVVQEALTNVHKHARGAAACVRVVGAPGSGLEVEVSNRPPVSADSLVPGAGLGLVGLAERVTLAGGSLSSGPLPDGGWRVVARMPWAVVAEGPS